jgi:hypothetical protein
VSGGCPVGYGTPKAFFLDGSVKAFDMGIVVRPTQPGMPSRHTIASEHLLKVMTELRAIVSLDHMEVKAKLISGM